MQDKVQGSGLVKGVWLEVSVNCATGMDQGLNDQMNYVGLCRIFVGWTRNEDLSVSIGWPMRWRNTKKNWRH